MLSLGDVLHHIVGHLQGYERQRLRSTCRTLRESQAILDSFESACATASPGPDDKAFLTRLRYLTSVHLESPTSLFPLHCLGRLHTLRIENYSAHALDLMPLTCLPVLRGLSLYDRQPVLHLGLLTQLVELEILHGCSASWQDILQLTSLQELRTDPPPDAATLAPLQRLTLLGWRTNNWGLSASSPLFQSACQLPALGALSLDADSDAFHNVASTLTALYKLTALQLDSRSGRVPDGICNLSILSRLQSLSLVNFNGCPRFLCPSITALHLEGIGEEGLGKYWPLPELVRCTNLVHLALDLHHKVVLEASRLPLQCIIVSIGNDNYDPGRLFFGTGLHLRLQVVRRASLTWPSIHALEVLSSKELP